MSGGTKLDCLSGGPYPTIHEQARRLQSESGMPEWSFETYVGWCLGVNKALLGIMIQHMVDRNGWLKGRKN